MSETLPTYSVAIRTLAANHDVLRRELESVFSQSVMPERVVIYIAQGYDPPPFRVASEVYVHVPKGMVAQRAVDYSEISSDTVMLLDDDVTLSPDSAEKMLHALVEHNLDCIAADTFQNHKMSAKAKLFAAFSNLTFPHLSQRYAFRMRRNGSFSYLLRPRRDVYLSQSAAGPCSLWRKDMLLSTAFADELWLDRLGFAYNDDGMEFFKLYVNGGRLGVHFCCGVSNEDARTMSDRYRADPRRFSVRAQALYLCWHRSMMLGRRSPWERFVTALSFWTKAAWLLPVHIATAVACRDVRVPWLYIQGLRQGILYTHTPEYLNLPPYRR